MNLARIIFIVAALAVAGLTAYLVNLLINQKDDDSDSSSSSSATTEILVAEKPLPAGLILTGEHFIWQDWPKGSVHKSFIARDKNTKIEKYIGYVVKSSFSPGEPIISGKLIKPGTPGFLPGALKPGMRAFTIKVNALTGASGFIVPGMQVDLVMTHRMKNANSAGQKWLVSETIMQNVRIIAVDQKVSDGGKAALRAKNITVEVTAKNVERLAIATRVGQIRLVVRSLVRDPKEEKLDPFTVQRDISEYFRLINSGNPVFLVAKVALNKGVFMRNVDVECRVFPYDTNIDGQISCTPGRIEALRGSLLLDDVKAGQAILQDDLLRSGQDGFIMAAMKPGMRAITVRASSFSTPPGFLTAGDRIDILLTSGVRARPNQYGISAKRVTETIFDNVRILALNGGSLTLEMTALQAQKITVARTLGAFTFLARRHDDTAKTSIYASDFDASKAYADSFTKDPVESLVKYDREQDRDGADQIRTRVYGGNVPNTLNIYPNKYIGANGDHANDSSLTVVVPETNKSE